VQVDDIDEVVSCQRVSAGYGHPQTALGDRLKFPRGRGVGRNISDSKRARIDAVFNNPVPYADRRPRSSGQGAADQKRYTAEYWMACCDPSWHDPAGAAPPVVRSRCTYVTLLNMPFP
jgi:hypothetical protein